ncbi:MAG: hypothetical protein IJ778_00555 [Alphaproteobacteria bacterium]|nr:hypothetical protein [Alphaproteobacteria bacterium]
MKKNLIVLSGMALFFANPCYSVDNYVITGDNYSYSYNVYKTGEKLELDDDILQSSFDIPYSYLSPLFTASKTWAAKIETAKKVEPVNYYLFSEDEYNAAAVSLHVDVKEKPYKVTLVNAAINNLTPTGPKDILETVPFDAYISLGLGIDEDHPGWEPYSGLHALYHEKLPDLHTVMLHEIMHSLGISTNVQQFNEDEGDSAYYFSEEGETLSVFDKDLRIYTGNMSKPFNPKNEIKPQPEMSVGEDEDFDVFEYSPYYVGETTLKVLSGKPDYNEAKQAIVDNGGMTNYSITYEEKKITYPKVFGMPIHNADDDEIDLSHLELRNSFMSHQKFRNWLTPMEAELAVLKDIGYNVELRKYFGKSYYLNGITDVFTTGYSEWNGSAYTGAFSNIPQGVGLHIYGNNNNITQASDIATVGEGAVGIRIDGVQNEYTLAGGSKIQTNGKENLGLAVTWGKNHIVNLAKNSEITAEGEKGIAASFDFGANLFGTLDTSRGSYINYDDDQEYNLKPFTETTDALVDSFNVAGTLKGSEAAIYISDSAHVKDINILDGAHIDGNIISEWNSIQSGLNAKVQTRKGDYWVPVNPKDISQIYFTNINIDEAYAGTINGDIIGDTDYFNTLKLNNGGAVTIAGDKVVVHTINNAGTMNLTEANLFVQDGQITGGGTINVAQRLEVNEEIETIDNKINLAEGTLFSTMNDETQDMEILELNADNAKISFDLGDTFALTNESVKDKATIVQIKADEEIAEQLQDGASVELFTTDNVLDLGSSYANIYYEGNKYTLTQSQDDEGSLDINVTATDVELGDAAADKTAANYIVTEGKLSKDAGIVKGNEFEISGESININGHKGLVIDKTHNPDGTTLKTSVFGASDSDLTVVNGGSLEVDASDKSITLGKSGKTALALNNGEALLNADDNYIFVTGNVKGADNQTDKLVLEGKKVSLHNLQNVNVDIKSEKTDLMGISKNTVWQANNGVMNIYDDSYLASDGSNQFIGNGTALNLMNDETNDITLSGMVLNKTTEAALDVDLGDFSTDRFVFANSDDLETNGNSINITGINLLNSDKVLSEEEYVIPFIAAQYHNEELMNNVIWSVDEDTLISPIFNYQIDYSYDEDTGGIVLSRGSASDYKSYNSSALVAPIAAQAGSYLSQLSIYDAAFGGLDALALPSGQSRAYRGMSSGDMPSSYSNGNIWFKPTYIHEKVDLKKGPRVQNNLYNALAGRDSGVYSARGWNYKYALYAGYTGSRQRYDHNRIHQNGGVIGATGAWYKNNFYTALTANAGMNFAKARTMYGNESFKTINAGIASQTGYNLVLANGRFIVQPNYLMSYTYIKTLNYKNKAGVKIKASPLQAVNIAPGLKTMFVINGWKPYAEAKMVWSLMDKTKFKAQDVNMPEMSTKPYVKYGLGLQKDWYTGVSAYGQAMRLDGGREGFEFTAGFSWAFGR